MSDGMEANTMDEATQQIQMSGTPRLEPGPGRVGGAGSVGVIAAIQAVMSDLGAVGKDDRHAQNFSYRSADSVVNAVSPLFAKHGVVLVPHVQPAPVRFTWETVKNAGRQNEQVRTDALTNYVVSYALFHTDGSALHGQIVTQGQGLTAYSPGAAMSYALKYFLSQVLMIPFDDIRMELDSQEYKEEVEGSQAVKPQWWQSSGWNEEAHHSDRRVALLEKLKAAPDEHLLAAKAYFYSHLTWVDDYSGNPATLWVPARDNKPKGPGQLHARIPMGIMERAETWLEEHAESAAAEAAGEEPFGVEPGEPVETPPATPGDVDSGNEY